MDSLNIKQLNIKFGEGTVWTMSVTCKWCGKYIKGQTEQRYKDRGNICDRCNVEKSEPSMTALEIIRTRKLIEQHHENMSLLAEGLDLEITEEERLIIEFKMEQEFEKIKALRFFLCQE
jgi:hypothetical protein